MKIAIINQRYGLEVNGGSELYSRQIAERLIKKYDVEVLTSCSVEYQKWANYYKEGVETINGVTVRRFKTEHERNVKRFTELDIAIHKNPMVGTDISNPWIEEVGPYCPSLVDYLEAHSDEYDVVIIVTYLYYPAVKSMPKVKDKVIFIPTAHQEPFIHFKMYEEIFKSPKGYIFLTPEEKLLVHGLFNNANIPYDIMGVGVDVPENTNAKRFKEKTGLDNYIIYVGRIDEGKDCPRLFKYFLEYKERNKNDIKLVLMGKEVVPVPKHPDIISMGFVSDEDKFDGISGAKALILPSKYESLSISVLEAMTLSIPVIVNGICDVLKGHCVKSNAGLYYKNYFEFEECVNYMFSHPHEYEIMKRNAVQYVKENFQWDIIMDKFDKMIEFVAGK